MYQIFFQENINVNLMFAVNAILSSKSRHCLGMTITVISLETVLRRVIEQVIALEFA